MEFQAALGQAVREARAKRGWTQDALAEAVETDRAYIGNLETGRRNPSFSTLVRIADALGVRVSDLTARVDDLRGASLELRDDESPT